MAYSFDGASDFLVSGASTAQAGATATPLTLSCWFQSANTTSNYLLCGVIENSGGGTNEFSLWASGGVAGDPVQAISRTTSSAAASSSTGFSANTWHHACGVFTSATSRAAFIDGGSKGTNTTSRTPGSLARYIIGSRNDATGQLNGLAAEFAIWSVALTDAEVAALGRGISPLLVRPASLLEYWPLSNSRLINVKSGIELSATGATGGIDHPRIIYPRRALWVPRVVAGGVKGAPHYANTQSFFGPTLVKDEILTPAALTNSSAFHAPRIRLSVATAHLSDGDTFQSPTLRHTYKPTALANGQSFYAPNAAVDITVGPAHLASGNSFASPTLRLTLKPAALNDGDAFYAPTVAEDAGIAPPHLANAQAFYAPTLRATLTPAHFADADAFYAPSLRTTVTPAALTNTQTFFSPTLRLTISPAAYGNGQTFYAPTVMQAGTVEPPLYVNSGAFYGPTVVRAGGGKVPPFKRRRRKHFLPLDGDGQETQRRARPASIEPEPQAEALPQRERDASAPLVAKALVEPQAPAPRRSKRLPALDHASAAAAALARQKVEKERAELLAKAEATLAEGQRLAAEAWRAGELDEARRLEALFHAQRLAREEDEERAVILAAMEMLLRDERRHR